VTFRRTPEMHDEYPGFVMSYRKSGKGVWYLEWRATSYSFRPVAVRKARDTEIKLIERILELEAQLANPSAPRPAASLNLRTFAYDPQTKHAKAKSNTPTKQPGPEAPRKLER
jgi:hypothetical protein